MSARLTLEFLDDGSMTHEHRISKDSEERMVEQKSPLSLMDIATLPIAAGTDMTRTHCVMIVTSDTYDDLHRRLDDWERRHHAVLVGGGE